MDKTKSNNNENEECSTRDEHGFCCCGMNDPNEIMPFSPHEENLSASESRMERSDEVSRENAEAVN